MAYYECSFYMYRPAIYFYSFIGFLLFCNGGHAPAWAGGIAKIVCIFARLG
jgi:hypothetical protein